MHRLGKAAGSKGSREFESLRLRTMEMKGTVSGGSAQASALGYPTANIPLQSDTSGIYVVRVLVEGNEYGGVAYADQARGILESHLFDFSGDLYGKEVSVTLVEKLRDSRSFATVEEQKQAIADDVHAARNRLSY